MKNKITSKIPEAFESNTSRPEFILSEALEGRDNEVRKSRDDALLRFSVANVQHLDKHRVVAVQNLLEHGDQFGVWETPRKWSPSEHSQSTMKICMRKRIAHILKNYNGRTLSPAVETLLDTAALVMSRYLILLRVGPVGLGRKSNARSLDPSTIKQLAYGTLPLMFAIAISKRLATRNIPLQSFNSKTFLKSIELDDLEILAERQKNSILNEWRRMSVLADRGLWSDVPALGAIRRTITAVSGPALKIAPEHKPNHHIPLPDEYVAAMGSRSLWLIESAAPCLIKVATEIRMIWHKTADASANPETIRKKRSRLLSDYLKDFIWIDGNGKTIEAPPFVLRMSQHGKASNLGRSTKTQNLNSAGLFEDSTPRTQVESQITKTRLIYWPPRTFADIIGLMSNVQMAHLFVIALSTGTRRSEALNFSRNCLVYARDGQPYANGETFKLVQRHDGETRDWVLPSIAVKAVEQQARIVELLETIGPIRPDLGESTRSRKTPDHLWGQVGGTADRTQPFTNFGKALDRYAQILSLDRSPGGQNLRPHRFRKTLARLAALALTQAPKILMDVFGHSSIEMTLYYILADKDLQGDIEKVSRELRIIKAEHTVSDMIAAEDTRDLMSRTGGYGGTAARTISAAIRLERTRVHARGEDWGSSNVRELAEILTLQGKAWQYVRSGVICTKYPGTESGPCNRSRGQPEPSRCMTHCKHRLEEAFLREDVNTAIAHAVEFYEQAVLNGDDLLAAHWAGQIRTQVGRFDDLRLQWSSNIHVANILAT
jgi:integrase